MNSEELKVKSYGWKSFAFPSSSFFALTLFLILSDLRSLKIEQQQIHTLLKPLLYLIVRKIYVYFWFWSTFKLRAIGNLVTISHVLHRKEVIQPHLPIRLPCYDLTPIIEPTFDCCLPNGLAHRLRVFPTFMV